MRTDTNIRLYDLASLQKLLNITLLHDMYYKISKIATYPQEKYRLCTRNNFEQNSQSIHSEFKMAMMNFDQELF
jgi:DNA-binding transcriptional MerR regulator